MYILTKTFGDIISSQIFTNIDISDKIHTVDVCNNVQPSETSRFIIWQYEFESPKKHFQSFIINIHFYSMIRKGAIFYEL